MQPTSFQRPLGRIASILGKLKHLWHYYPACSLAELVREVTDAANRVEAKLPSATMHDIEDIAYPEGSAFAGLRHLDMGIDALEEAHAAEPLPPVPIQTALMDKIDAAWRKHPQMRLGQLLQNAHDIAQLRLEKI